jgi:hypothetical protein
MTCFWRQPDNLRFPATPRRAHEAGLFGERARNAAATPANIAQRSVAAGPPPAFAGP